MLREQFQPPTTVGFHLHGKTGPHELGIKLVRTSSMECYIFSIITLQTCGFEILLSQLRDKGEIIDYQSDLHWNHFVASLQDKGYFQV